MNISETLMKDKLCLLDNTQIATIPQINETTTLVRVGVIGCGYWGPNLIRNLYDLPQSKVVGVSDLRQERLAPLAKKYPGIKLTNRYQDLLEDESIDAIVIATPISSHYELARQALLAGKHVLVEKPLTATSKQAELLTDLAKRKNKILMVGHTFEYNPAVLKVHELIKTKALGDIYYIDSTRVNLGLYQTDGQNVIWDLAPHDISIILRWIGEMPESVSARGRCYAHKAVYDIAFIHLEFPGGILANIHVSWLAPAKIRRTTVVGSEKMVIYDDLEASERIKIADRGALINPACKDIKVDYRMGDIVSPHIEIKEPLMRECSHFLDSILNRSTPQTDGENGSRVVKVLELADKSMKLGGKKITF